MRIPKSWNDKGILEDEPFRSAFEKGEKQFHTRNGERYQLVEKLKVSGTTVVNLWHKKCLALSRRRENHPTTTGHNDRLVEIEYRTIQTFVDFYWNLFIGDEATANLCLQRLLISQGYDFVGPALTDNVTNATNATILTNSINISHSGPLNMGKSSLPDHIRESGKTKAKAVGIPFNKHTQRKAPFPHLRTKGTKSSRNRLNQGPAVSSSFMLGGSETKLLYSESQNGRECLKKNGDAEANSHQHQAKTGDLLVYKTNLVPDEDEAIPGASTKQSQASQTPNAVDTLEKNRNVLRGLRFKKNVPTNKPAADIDQSKFVQSASPTSLDTQQNIKSEENLSEENNSLRLSYFQTSPRLQQVMNPLPNHEATPAHRLFCPAVPSLDDMGTVLDVPGVIPNSNGPSFDIQLVHAEKSRSMMEPRQQVSNLQEAFHNIAKTDIPNKLLPMKRQRSMSRDCVKRQRLGYNLLPGPLYGTGKGDEKGHILGLPKNKDTDKAITAREKVTRSDRVQGSLRPEGSSACSQEALWKQSVAKNTTPLKYPSTSVEAASLSSSSAIAALNQQAPNNPSDSSSDQRVPALTTRKRKSILDQNMGVKKAPKVVMKRPRSKSKVVPMQKWTSNRPEKAGTSVDNRPLSVLRISPDSSQGPKVQIKEELSEVLPQTDAECVDSVPTFLDENGNREQLQTEENGLAMPYNQASNSEGKVISLTLDIAGVPDIGGTSSQKQKCAVDEDALPLIPFKQEQIESNYMNLVGNEEGPSKLEETEPYIEAPFDKLPDTEQYYYLPKPALPELPPIWAESRQEICESFDWFRSYQGGVYHVHNVVKGYLLGGFPSSRDRFEHGGRLIISHGGGKAESLHTKQGKTTYHPASDQMAQDKSVRALYDNYVNNRPLVLLVDDKYALFPYDLKAKGVTYAVLGLYTIVYAWAEYQPANNELGRVVRYKFAFRWCDHQGIPWWNFEETQVPSVESDPLEDTSRGSITVVREISPAKTEEFVVSNSSKSSPDTFDSYPERFLRERRELSLTCYTCLRRFVRIFEASWVCLNPKCQRFWRQANGRFLPIQLDYHPNFLELPLSKPNTDEFETIVPESPLSFLFGDNVTNYAFTRGFHCTSCGRLSCRYKWETWECMHCGHSITIERPPRDVKDFVHQGIPVTFKNYSLNPISDIIALPQATFAHDAGRGFIQTFILPYTNARIHHIQSGSPRGRKEADQIFLDYQVQATKGTLKFRRWPMRAHKCRGSLLTNYFSQNSGVPYKYVGGDLNTVPLESAPDAVVKARSLLEKRLNEAIGVKAEFNEVLSAAYMERQKMAFHSDNEVGLGPLVAGLSLGSPALMHFRLHPKFDPERTKKGILLSVVLRHGDILVMDGSAVQEYYEHTVVPTNFRIAATARQINAALHA